MSTAATPTELPRSYVPAEHEDAILGRWDDSGLWHPDPNDDRPPYSIVIPPPNVTAALHLGHAFNNTIQDILIRTHRMRGHNVLWMPGTDHAGIATQTVVEKRLLAEGKRRLDFTREAFVETVQAWKDEYEATISGQLRAMGCSCDWERQRFTMDEHCARAVMEAFFTLFRDDLVYRGKRLVNWDPITRTALADDEVEMRDVDGSFWYLRYPVVNADGQATGETVTVATTRPETMLGDTAVAVNPDDPARAAFAGQWVRLPIVGRVIPIVADDYVVAPDPESDDTKAQYASGFLKVTPAHDPNDWEIGRRHDLAAINVMAPDASISDAHGWEDVSDEARAFVGMSREDARTAIVAWFEANGLLEATKPYTHAVGHSYRSHQPIEPYLSDQWYVRVTDDRLVGEAQRALAPEQRTTPVPDRAHGTDTPGGDGALRFHPPRYARSYEAWHDDLRDWCISRQLWWGHRIPIWTRDLPAGSDEIAAEVERWTARGADQPGTIHAGTFEHADGVTVQVCVNLGRDGADTLKAELESAGYEQDPDVLDTWFSSGLWPISTMGWPEPPTSMAGLLETFNPTNVLCTGRDIITLWVSRMVMFNRAFRDRHLPFRDVYIHPMIQDGHGQRMSKSLGNGVDPRDIIHSHGADALRFTMTGMATLTQDARLPVDMVSPFSDEVFQPKEIISPEGNRVAAPEQTCPKTGRTMVSGYGRASGLALPSEEKPLARNTSSKFDLGRNFCNKLWNATRFAIGRLGGPAAPETVSAADRPLVDRWILSRLHEAVRDVDAAVDEYRFAAYAETMYALAWRDVCSSYIEAIKSTVDDDPAQQQVLRTVLDTVLRLLHPVCPFVTETLWPAVQATGPAGIAGFELAPSELLAGAAWPAGNAIPFDAEAVATWDRIQTLVGTIRAERARHNVPDKKRITLHATPEVEDLVGHAPEATASLAGLEQVQALGTGDRPAGAIAITFEGAELLLSGLVDAVDVGRERARLEKLVAEKTKSCAGMRGKLANRGYVDNAPAHVVEQTRSLLAQAEADLAAAEAALAALGDGG